MESHTMKKPIEIHCRMAPVTGLILLLTLSGIPAERTAAEETVPFKMHRVGQYRSEALGVGDFNSDDLLDIVAGPYVYLAPNWKPVEIRHLEGEVDNEGRGYMHDFANLPLDVDQDGRLDGLVAERPLADVIVDRLRSLKCDAPRGSCRHAV
jgi:hypothetical protein